MDIPKEFLSKEFLSQFKTGEDVTAFMKELHTRVYEQMLEAEMDNHLGYEKHSNQGDHSGNSRNGSYRKQIQTEMGESVIQVPRDREGEFEPIVIPKHQSRGLSIERLVISLYAKGMSVADIESEMQEIYGINLSTSAISIITNKVSQAATEWQNRPLESLYMIVWMDGIVFKVRENGKVINKTVYLCVGLNKEGLKEVLGMWKGSGTEVTGLSDIGKAKSIALADGSVPVGKYTRQAMVNAGMLDKVDDVSQITTSEIQEALGGVEINKCANVGAVTAAVAEGSNEVGTVYYSDTYGFEDRLQILEVVPYELTGNVIYPVAQIINKEADELEQSAAEDFINFLTSDDAKTIFQKYYFDTDVE